MPSVHRTPVLPILAAAYVGGAIAGAILGGSWALTFLLTALGGLAVVLAGTSARGTILLVCCMIAVASVAHHRVERLDARPAPPLAAMTGTHEVVGVVRDTPVTSGTSQRTDVDVDSVDGAAIEGGVRGWFRVEGAPLEAGDRIRFTAALVEPPAIEAFDYATFLRDRDIYLVAESVRGWERIGWDDLGGPPAGWQDAVRDFHGTVVGRIEQAMPEPASSLAAGVLVGERSALPEELDEALRATGTTHLVVVSGQNVALLLGIAVALLTSVVSRRVASAVGLLALPAYVVFVGAEPPVVRAAIMAVAVVAASITGRRTPSWVYLTYAAGLMLAVEPVLIRDVSFQLSASATAGIVTFAPTLRDAALARFPALASPGRTAALSVATTATGAALAAAPVQVGAFGVLAPWTIVANVVVAPLYEATVAAAALAAALGGTPIATALGPMLSIPPRTFLWVVEALAGLPGTTLPLRVPLAAGIVLAATLVVATAALSRWATGVAEREAPPVLEPGAHTGIAITTGLAVVAVGLWWTALTPTPAYPSVTVLDVGQGLAVLVQDGGTTMLIDTGPPDGAVMQALGRAGIDRRLDAVVLTHADADHAGGLAELQRRLTVDAVYVEASTVGAYPAEAGVQPVDIGDRWRLGAVTIEVLAPPVATRDHRIASSNEASLVVAITIGERRVLVPGDIEAAGEAWLVSTGVDLRSDVLVVPHHGSQSSTSPAFLEAVDPTVAVISVGRNPYGHPHEAVLERLAEESSLSTYRTDEHGAITFRSDGVRLWVTTE